MFLIIAVEDKTFLFFNFDQIRTLGWKKFYTNVLKIYQKAIIDRSYKDVLTKKKCTTIYGKIMLLHSFFNKKMQNVLNRDFTLAFLTNVLNFGEIF